MNQLPLILREKLTAVNWPVSTLRIFDNAALNTEDMLTASFERPSTKQMQTLEFYVATTHRQPIPSLEARLQFDLLAVREENICAIHATPHALTALTAGLVEQRYSNCCSTAMEHCRMRSISRQIPAFAPVQIPLRRLPVPIADKVIAELSTLCDDGIMAPSPCISAPLAEIVELPQTMDVRDAGRPVRAVRNSDKPTTASDAAI